MFILVTGGLGFIGSHTAITLISSSYDVIILDNLINSKISTLHKIAKICELIEDKDNIFLNKNNHIALIFKKIDIKDKINLQKLFSDFNGQISAVIHFAGLKAVKESISLPLKYYQNNISGTLNLLEIMNYFNCKKIIFSSSATVYGNQTSPLNEKMPSGIGITNPYGQTKFMIEQILKDLSSSDLTWNIISLRYFNPIGAHDSGLIGEDPEGIPNNLMPYLLRVADPNLPEYPHLKIYGNDYDTVDGTCIRDFIHVVDLAQGHLKALEKINTRKDLEFIAVNLGTGQGTSVLELINIFQNVNNIKINYIFDQRREGDKDIVYAENDLAKTFLNWKPKFNIEDMCRDSWNFILR